MKIHIDIDSFFVSALRIQQPHLEGRPVAVGGRSDMKIFDADAIQKINFENSGSFVPTFFKEYELKDDDIENFRDSSGRLRGILVTASYEARAYGIYTGMKIEEALLLCPELVIKSPNMPYYQKLSYMLKEFLIQHIPIVEQASIDEFYGDLTGWIPQKEYAQFIEHLQSSIKKELYLPVSIGAAQTKFLAKLATSFAKPYGTYILDTKALHETIKDLHVEKFPGIGNKMALQLHKSGIYTLGELLSRKERLYSLGSYAKEIYERVSAQKDEPLKNIHQRKSIGISRTIEPLYDRKELARRIHVLVRHLSYAIVKLGVFPTSYRLSLKYEMDKKSKAGICSTVLFNERFFDHICMKLLEEADIYKRLQVIRISIYCGSFTRDSKKELDITSFYAMQNEQKLGLSTHKMREKYGLGILKWGSEL
jgi:DNA polymerase-4